MANEILQKIDEFGEAVVQMRTANDKSIEELKTESAARAKELEIQADRWNKKIDASQKQISLLLEEKEKDRTRIEILEALADRPKGTPTEQMEQKHVQKWEKWIRGKCQDQNLKNEIDELHKKIMEAKADSVLVGTALLGGNAVPKTIGDAIEKLVLNQSEIAANVKTIQASSGDYNELVTIAGANGGFIGEGGSRSQTNAPNIRKVTVTVGELYAYPKIGNWALNDIFFNVVNWVQEDVAATFAVSLSTAIFDGNGSSKPTGMTNTTPTTANDYASPLRAAAVYEYMATTVTGSPEVYALAADDLIDLQYLVRSGYQSNAVFAMNSVTQGYVRKLKDSNNQYLWQPNYQAGQPATLLAKPVITWEDLGGASTADEFPVAYGDFRRAYLLAKIGPMEMITDKVTAPGYTNFFTYQRYGGIPLNNDAVKFLKNAA